MLDRVVCLKIDVDVPKKNSSNWNEVIKPERCEFENTIPTLVTAYRIAGKLI